MAKVSVIVPVYKVEKYLARCIDSILAQTFSDFELILVDDGSPDNCGKICDEYALRDSRVKIAHQQNAGVAMSRNKGLDMANGEFVCFVDSDDFVENEYLEVLMLREEDLSIAGCRNCDTDGRQIDIARKEEFRTEIVSSQNIGKWFDHGSLYSVWTSMFRREIIEKSHLRFDCKTFRGEDTIFMLSYVQLCKSVRFCQEIIYNYVRYGCGTLTTSNNPMNFHALAYLDCYLNEWFSANNVKSVLFASPYFWTRQETKVLLYAILKNEEISSKDRYKALTVFCSIPNFYDYMERFLRCESKKYKVIMYFRSRLILMGYSAYLRKKK